MIPPDYTVILTGAFGIGAGITSILKFVVPLISRSNSNGKSKYVYADVCNVTHTAQEKLADERHNMLLAGQKEIKDELVLLRK